MELSKFLFGDMVVVADKFIGVVVDTFINEKQEYFYKVYVRCSERIEEYGENEIERYRIRRKELDGFEQSWNKRF